MLSYAVCVWIPDCLIITGLSVSINEEVYINTVRHDDMF